MEKLADHPVFICGHPKAGTSLMTALLDGHPAILAYPEETLFFRRFLPAIADQPFEDQLVLVDQLLIHIFEWNTETPPAHQADYPDRDYSEISFEGVRSRLRGLLFESPDLPKDYLPAAVLAFGQEVGMISPDVRYWVEKSPYNEFYAEKIFDWWPEARCIHIVRDPRDNFVSYRRKQPDWSAKVFIWNWVRSTRAGLKNAASFGEDRYLMIRFEDLLRETKSATQRVADFLELPWHPALEQPTRVGESWRGNSMFAEKYAAVSTAPLGRWRQADLSPFDLAMLQVIGGDVMEAMAYKKADLPLSSLSLSERVRLMRERMVSWIKRP